MRLACCLVLAALAAGCLDGRGAPPCAAPTDAVDWPDPWQTGVVLSTVREGQTVSAWGCNEGEKPVWVLEREGTCVGSWSWTVTGPEDDVAYASGPGGHYGECDDWTRIDPAHGVAHTFDLRDWASGDTMRIRLQVYTQPEMLEDAGGGPVVADIVV